MGILTQFRKLHRHREVLINLIQADLKLRYRRSILGYGWSLLYPLASLAIMAVVFSEIMKFKDLNDYVLYVFAGLLPWNFLLSSLWGAGPAIIFHESLLKKIYLPKALFPVAATFARLIDFLVNLVALFILMCFIAFKPSLALISLPLAIIILCVFIAGVCMAISAITVYIRDTAHLIAIATQLGFYLTPIIYPPDVVATRFHIVFTLNPVAHIVRLFQTILYRGEFPVLSEWSIASGIAALALIVGVGVFSRLEQQLIFRL